MNRLEQLPYHVVELIYSFVHSISYQLVMRDIKDNKKKQYTQCVHNKKLFIIKVDESGIARFTQINLRD